MRYFSLVSLLVLLLTFTGVAARAHHHDQPVVTGSAITNSVILIVRHAEKPVDGDGLTPAGQARAQAYVHYFETYTLDGHPLHFNYLFAAADSASSMRPRLTLEPLSNALGLPLNTNFKNKHYEDLVAYLQTVASGKNILICWHHEEIANLLTALGADPNQLIPNDTWPEDQYGWVIQLCYDKNGHLIPGKTRRIDEHLAIR